MSFPVSKPSALDLQSVKLKHTPKLLEPKLRKKHDVESISSLIPSGLVGMSKEKLAEIRKHFQPDDNDEVFSDFDRKYLKYKTKYLKYKTKYLKLKKML